MRYVSHMVVIMSRDDLGRCRNFNTISRPRARERGCEPGPMKADGGGAKGCYGFADVNDRPAAAERKFSVRHSVQGVRRSAGAGLSLSAASRRWPPTAPAPPLAISTPTQRIIKSQPHLVSSTSSGCAFFVQQQQWRAIQR